MDTPSTPYRTNQCSECPGDTEYYCKSCACDLCLQCNLCKDNHVKDLKTIDHNVMAYRDSYKCIPTKEVCTVHLYMFLEMYCQLCELPVCYHCIQHRTHRWMDIHRAYQTKRQQHRGTIHTIRSEALFYRPVLLTGIKADVKICHTEFSNYQSHMFTKAQRLKYVIYYVLNDLMVNVFCDFDFTHRCLKQKLEMIRHLASLQKYIHIYEHSAIRPLQFLSCMKKARLLQIHLTLHTCQLSMTESLNKRDVIESLSEIQMTGRGKRRVRNDCLLKLMSSPEFHQSLTVTGVDGCEHISFVTSDRVWVSDSKSNLILFHITDGILYHVEDFNRVNHFYGGVHTVNSESELIYIDRKYNIKKLSMKMETTTTFIGRTDYTWTAQCVYWSPSTGDLLVGMYRKELETGKVTRYNQSGQLTQTIQHDNTGRGLYSEPSFITENNNGDVVVSDTFDVVVTERGGRHRFSYSDDQSILMPQGICTDALSHILVCDASTKTVQMLDKDGHFLSHLLIRPSGIFEPTCLSYDVKTHLLWVGSYNKVCIYRYIYRQDSQKDFKPTTVDAMGTLNGSQTKKTEKSQEGNEYLMKPKLLHSLTVKGLKGVFCSIDHISCVTPGRVWVSDGDKLMLINTAGDTLHFIEKGCADLVGGVHTLNNESELFYINWNYNINKLSKDMNTTTTFIKTDSTWRPYCVCWSPSTGDLLVGMCNKKPRTAKVTRYNHIGQLTQTIQYDEIGMELYDKPRYITENINKDVVVSDSYSAVVVTDGEGKYRFLYTGHPSGSKFGPCGICIDAKSHILVCDELTRKVHMLDRDGQFLSYILIRLLENFTPIGLNYDANTEHLWIGSQGNTLYVFRYITNQDALTGEHQCCHDGDAASSSALACKWR